jgi:hypothetical protein
MIHAVQVMKIKPSSPSKPGVLTSAGSLLDRLEPAQRKVLLVGLVFFFLMAASTTLVLAYMVFETEITSFLQKQKLILNYSPVSQPAQQPAIIIPTQTPSCSGASLQLGANVWHIGKIQHLAEAH